MVVSRATTAYVRQMVKTCIHSLKVLQQEWGDVLKFAIFVHPNYTKTCPWRYFNGVQNCVYMVNELSM